MRGAFLNMEGNSTSRKRFMLHRNESISHYKTKFAIAKNS